MTTDTLMMTTEVSFCQLSNRPSATSGKSRPNIKEWQKGWIAPGEVKRALPQFKKQSLRKVTRVNLESLSGLRRLQLKRCSAIWKKDCLQQWRWRIQLSRRKRVLTRMCFVCWIQTQQSSSSTNSCKTLRTLLAPNKTSSMAGTNKTKLMKPKLTWIWWKRHKIDEMKK